MKIYLTDGYYIVSVPFKFILIKEYVIENGEFAGNKTTKNIGFYRNTIYGLKQLLERYLEVCALDSEKAAEDAVNRLIESGEV